MSETPVGPLRRHVFARVLSFDVECPNCGAVDCVRTGRQLSPRFHPFRSRWRCRDCRRIYAVGLLLSPVRRAGNHRRNGGFPLDTRPTLRQLGEMRRVLGLLREQSVGWYDGVNLICICGADEDAEHTSDCPLAYESW